MTSRASRLALFLSLRRNIDGPHFDCAADVASQEEVTIQIIKGGHNADQVLVRLVYYFDIVGGKGLALQDVDVA